MNLRVFKVRNFVLSRPDAWSPTGESPFANFVLYVVAKNELEALEVAQRLRPEEHKDMGLDLAGEVISDQPLWQVRVGPREPGSTGPEHRCAMGSRYFLIGAQERRDVAAYAAEVMKGDAHVVEMIRRGWIEVSDLPLRLDRAAIY